MEDDRFKVYKENLLVSATRIKDNAEISIQEEYENPVSYRHYNQGKVDAMKQIIECIENY